MLKCVFLRKDSRFCGFSFSGHAGYGFEGSDIVCAAVSSAVMLTCNAVTEYFDPSAEVAVEENRISLRLSEPVKSAVQMISALYTHIEMIAQDYKKVKLEIDEEEKP